MEISKLYENAAERLEKAIEVCGKSKITLSSLTVISTAAGNLYSGINWKTLNDSYEEELTCSEDEALEKMLISGETAIEHIITLDPNSKLPINPCQKCLELIIRINHANMNCNVITGKNSKVVLVSVNNEIAKFAEQFAVTEAAAEEPAKPEAPAVAAENQEAADKTAAEHPSGPEGSAAHAGIDASGLQMIFDDWESSEATDTADTGNNSKPFSASSLTSIQADQTDVANQVQNMANNNYQQQTQQNPMYANGMNGMYQQQMNGMYGQPMNGMYQQQPNGMYGQPMNGMYGQPGMYGGQQSMMYGQQMNGMYGQPNGMYQQQPNGMYGQNGMYQQQPNGMYGQQMNGMYGGGVQQSLYLNPQNQPAGGNNANQAGMGAQNGNTMYGNIKPSGTSTYRSKLNTSVTHSAANTQSVSVYGTNMNDSDNNAIFKGRLNDILNSGSSAPKAEESDKMDVMMSAKEKKNAAKKDAKRK